MSERTDQGPAVPADMTGCTFLRADDIGTAAWWSRVAACGTPLIERRSADDCLLTFLWRDPAGDVSTSPHCRVYVDVNSVTDHHSFTPQCLTRIVGTDIWFWQVALPANWRGSYAFIPITHAQLPPEPEGDAQAQRAQQRQWWMSIADGAMADPLNRAVPLMTPWGAVSAAHLPAAPDQSVWQAYDQAQASYDPARLYEFDWQDHPVWIYTTGQGEQERPLVLLLDGQYWGRYMPIFSALDAATQQGKIPPAVFVLIDSINGECRNRDLACNARFWQDIQDELLPRVAALAPHSQRAEQTVVAGQSLGGLAAMYAGLNWSQRFGCVLSQSGSFWWPHVELLFSPSGDMSTRKAGASGWLAQAVRSQHFPASQLYVWQEVGSREDVMIDVNESLREALIEAGHVVRYRVFEGGHDRLCWRGGLIEGLADLLTGKPLQS